MSRCVVVVVIVVVVCGGGGEREKEYELHCAMHVLAFSKAWT